jgi:hypothetical protein
MKRFIARESWPASTLRVASATTSFAARLSDVLRSCPRHHFTDCVDGFENIVQANKMSSLDHSNNPYRFGLDLRS